MVHAHWRWLVAGIILALYFVSPPREAMDQGLDSSNYGTYATFVAEGRQYGTEVIPMAGPLGFVLYGHTYPGELFYTRLVLELLLKLSFAALLLHLTASASRKGVAALWLGLVIVMVPAVDDLLHDYAILLAGLVLLRSHHGGSSRWASFAAAVLGPLALFKGTHLVTTGMVVGVACSWGVLRGRIRPAVTQAAIFAGLLLFAWMFAGQNPLHLPAYIHNVLDLSAGYNATMGLDEPPVLFATGLSLAVGFGLFGTQSWWHSRHSGGTTVALLLVALFAFLKWKHGFLRADGHVIIFFAAMAVLAPTVWLISRGGLFAVPTSMARVSKLVGLALFTAVVVGGMLGASGFWGARVVSLFTDVAKTLPRNLDYVLFPAATKTALDEKLADHARDIDLPQIRNEVGRDPIDFFGYEQGVLLLNHLNYQPRPMGGGTFNVFTPRLQQINADHVRDGATAPPWILFKLGYLDERLPSADDGLTLRAVLDDYAPALMQREYLLLERRKTTRAQSEPLPLGEFPVTLGEPVTVPHAPDSSLVLFSLRSELSTSGKLQKLFYRVPDMAIRLKLGGREIWREYNLKPTTVRQPTILSPLIDSTDDVIELYGESPGISVDEITFTAEPGFDPSSLRVAFFAAPRPLPPEETDIDEIRTYAQHPLFNRDPEGVVSDETGIKELNKETIQIVHAPGSITWALQPGDQQVIFSYGLMPQAYAEEGRSDGVEFNVEILWPDGDGRVLWQRMMRPHRIAADRGMQRLRLALPPFETGMRLRIRTHPGTDNDGAYDQSYITRLQIKSGPLIPSQFSGLGAVPASQTLPRSSVAGIGERPVYLLHAPNEVRIPIPDGAAHVSLESGMLPGSYQNGGNSDGVEFGLFVALPDGEKRYITGWTLNPRDIAADRGPHIRSADLGLCPAGSELIIATNVGPHGDRGWDQSYICNLTFN